MPLVCAVHSSAPMDVVVRSIAVQRAVYRRWLGAVRLRPAPWLDSSESCRRRKN